MQLTCGLCVAENQNIPHVILSHIDHQIRSHHIHYDNLLRVLLLGDVC